MNFNDTDRKRINQFLETVSKSKINGLSTKDELWSLTNSQTKALLDKIVALNPKEYGFRGKQVPQESVPKDAIKIDNRTDNSSGEHELVNSAYLPKEVYRAFEKMAGVFSKEYPVRKLMVSSGYRSPAFQVLTLLYILAKIYDFDLSQTLKRVAMPQYSQHCSANNTAIDMLNIDGEPSDDEPEKFKDSIEYKWITENASKFNFYESYPSNNPDGIMWEPWHWQYIV